MNFSADPRMCVNVSRLDGQGWWRNGRGKSVLFCLVFVVVVLMNKKNFEKGNGIESKQRNKFESGIRGSWQERKNWRKERKIEELGNWYEYQGVKVKFGRR